MKISIPLAAAGAAAALALAGCTTPATDTDGACAATSTSNWRAWIDAMPGPERPHLIVNGQVTVPTGGYRIALAPGAVREIDPPVQEFVLTVDPPDGPATQAMVTHEVVRRMPALPRYGAVVVRCGSEIVAEISPIGTAH